MKRFLLFVGISLTLGGYQSTLAAPPPQFFVSWQARTYAPPTYTGKILPTAGAPVTVTFELLEDGKPRDLSRQLVRWYANGNLHQSGTGLQAVTVLLPPLQRDDLAVRIVLPRYRGGADLEETIIVPVTVPEAVIDAPYQERVLKMTGANVLRGLFYFFNISSPRQLSIRWTANSRVVAADPPDILRFTLPAAARRVPIHLNLSVKNSNLDLEFAENTLTFTAP